MKNNPSPTTMKEKNESCCHWPGVGHCWHCKEAGENPQITKSCPDWVDFSQSSEEKHGTELSVPWEEKGVEGWEQELWDLVPYEYSSLVAFIHKQIQEARREVIEEIEKFIEIGEPEYFPQSWSPKEIKDFLKTLKNEQK